jgi:hypothetical protein
VGIRVSTVLAGAPALAWPKIVRDSVRSALWTGNNTFRAFSTKTIDLVALTCLAALALWLFSHRKRADRVAALYCAVFLAALAYAGALANVSSHGVVSTPAPWYTQVIVAPLLAMALAGAARWGRAGTILAACIAMEFGYVLAVTYVFRLIPLYAGFEGRGTVSAILALYRDHAYELSERLGSTALGPAWLIFALTAAVVVMIAVQESLLLKATVFRKAGRTSAIRG